MTKSNGVRVKAVEGRIARRSPRGELIPHDRFVKVPMTQYIHRLINVWGDVEVEPAKKPAPKSEAVNPPEAPKKAADSKPAADKS